jgi:uncharacterized repeat protein (TIGR03809 family)
MTHRIDVARSRDIAARWCALAEQRLEHLTELFETGRWRRYHSERAFLENIQEAKTAVEIWRGLATREAAPDNNSAAEGSWLGVAPLRRDASGDRVQRFSPQLTDIPVHSPPFDVSMSTETEHVYSDEAPSAQASDAPALNDISELVLNLDAIEDRYPLLRNAL